MPDRSCRSGFPRSTYSRIAPLPAPLTLRVAAPKSNRTESLRLDWPMRLTSLADYAVVMLTAAARHKGDGCLSANVLAEETGVPLATAQRLSGRLAAAGLLR